MENKFKIITNQNVYTLRLGMILRVKFESDTTRIYDYSITQKRFVYQNGQQVLVLIGKNIERSGSQKFYIGCKNPQSSYQTLNVKLLFKPNLNMLVNKILKL